MIGFIARVLPYVIIVLAWFYLNRALDKIKDKKEIVRQHSIWGKIFFLYGWIFNQNMIWTILRYIITGGLGFWILRWFFIATSSG